MLLLAACHSKQLPTSSPDKPKVAVVATAPADRPVMTSVALGREGGTFTVPVTINGAIKLGFTIDSGASDVQIPADVVMTMVRSGTLDRSDFIGQKVYQLADGSQLPSYVFRIRSLQVGDVTVRDVTGAIASQSGLLLLGQSFLSRLSSWSMNNQAGTLMLGTVTAGGEAVPMSPKPQIAMADKPDAARLPADDENGHKTIVVSYLAAGSQNDIGPIRSLYAQNVMYYGRYRSIDDIIAEKTTYINRWPERTYRLRDQSFSEQCSDNNTCVMGGIIDWTAANPAAGRRASGVARVELGYSNGLITREYSKVIVRR